MSTRFSIGYSPCPNDTFIFDALVHQKIATDNFQFDVHLHDVETLNEMAFENRYTISKLSYHAYLYVQDTYQWIRSGSALGAGCGPIIVANKSRSALSSLDKLTIAIPGKYTTAHFLLKMAFPEITQKIEVVFSDIESAVQEGRADLGLLIHESRFTFHEKGLHLIADLGAWWEKRTEHLIPLGGIAVRRNLPEEVKQQIAKLVQQSVQFAFDWPNESLHYSKQHAQEMDGEVLQKHIELYVNKYSLDIGIKGIEAVRFMANLAIENGLISSINEPLFVQ